jgi:hypothetical protein
MLCRNIEWESEIMLPENPVMVGVGVLLMLASQFSKSRMAPFGGERLRPVTDTERVILFTFGLFAFILGLVRIIHR